MKISFDFFGTGAGDNGGTRTCIESANALVDLGHEVYIYSHCPSKYTWSETKAKHLHSSSPNDFPEVDILIATASTTVRHAVRFPHKKRGFYWVRGIEVWSCSMERLIKGYKSGLILMANSEWQKKFIEENTGEKVYLQYPGLEIDYFIPYDDHFLDESFSIGGLFHAAPHKGFKTFVEIIKYFPNERIKLLSATPINVGEGWDLCVAPSDEDKRAFYQSCYVWLATTNLDGLHLPPMEAGLCGASLVCSAKPQSGMLDHAVHRETALTFISVQEAVNFINFLKESPMYRRELNKRHRKLLVEKMGSREWQMRKMAELFKSHL